MKISQLKNVILKIHSGNTPSKNNKKFWNGDTPWISGKEITEKYLTDSNLKLTQDGVDYGAKISNINDLLILVRGKITDSIRVGICNRKLAYNQDIKCITPNHSLLDHEFLYYLIKGNENHLLSKVELTGLGAQKIDTEQLLNLKIKLPEKTRTKKNCIISQII